MRLITFGLSLAAIADAIDIIWRHDKKDSEFTAKHDDFPFAFPWPARQDVFRPICGGTMITRQHMITAAHCVETDYFNNKPDDIPIVHRGNTYFVKEKRTLSCYTKKKNETEDIFQILPADIAILVLNKPIPDAVAGVDYIDVWDVKKQGETFLN